VKELIIKRAEDLIKAEREKPDTSNNKRKYQKKKMMMMKKK
jgi:hypothetical protein